MSKDEQAKKLTQDLLDAAVDRAIINQKAQGREFSLQDIKRLKAKHVFDKEDIILDAAVKDKKDNDELFDKIMNPNFKYKSVQFSKPSTNTDTEDWSAGFDEGYGVGFEEGKMAAEKEWRAIAQDTIGMMTMFFGEVPERKDKTNE
jgi:hypothetical protein